MYEIPKIKDKIKALYLYIESNRSDYESAAWSNWHNPKIVGHLNDLSKADCEILILKIWDWDADMLISLADPFLEVDNSNLDGFFLYCMIFFSHGRS